MQALLSLFLIISSSSALAANPRVISNDGEQADMEVGYDGHQALKLQVIASHEAL